MVCTHTGLDPFLKQVYAIKRGGKVTHQTGIDGYRSTAENTHEYAGSDEATFEECGCGDADSPANHPSVARVVVHRMLPNGHVVDQTGVARFHELKPAHFKKDNAQEFTDAMWWRMPYNQLSKCAEANGLRKAFPRILGGVYITDEMQQEVIDSTAVEVTTKTSAKDRLAAKRAAAESTATVEPEGAQLPHDDLAETQDDSETSDETIEAAFEEYAADPEPIAPTPVWGAPSAPTAPPPYCPNGHGQMAVSNFGGFWCKTKDCKEKVR
jgi:phage recombination protein Bet